MAADGDPGRQAASPLQVVKAVLSAFLGIRKRSEHDAVRITPMQVIITGVVCAALFVVTLLTLVRYIVG